MPSTKRLPLALLLTDCDIIALGGTGLMPPVRP
jgi:hypothetical protein